jgi:hypothetical protein
MPKNFLVVENLGTLVVDTKFFRKEQEERAP